MSSSRRKLLLNKVAVDIGCGCRRTDLSSFFWPKPRTRFSKSYPKSDLYQSSSTSLEASAASLDDSYTSFSPTFNTGSTPHLSEPEEPQMEQEEEEDPKFNTSKTVKGFDRIGGSVAVVKDSSDPYLDFRHSMLQMILEKEIYSREDLRELLQCFLSLNSPHHHEIIVQAFTEIWNGVFSMEQFCCSSKARTIRRRSRDLVI